MNAIEAAEISKIFRMRQKEKGMKGSLKAILHPQIAAVFVFYRGLRRYNSSNLMAARL